MSERNRAVYVTADSSDWLAIDFPFGLISPPELDMHRPMVGTVQFFHADSYRLRIPAEAKAILPDCICGPPVTVLRDHRPGCPQSDTAVIPKRKD